MDLDSTESTDRRNVESSEEEYFTTSSPPSALKLQVDAATSFVTKHFGAGRRVALVTSGGTTVPLEKQTVRFIDNFSAGTRGATSTEYFLESGYAVIFFYRKFSLQPYSRHFSHSTNCFLDFLSLGDDKEVKVKDDHQSEMANVLRKYLKVKEEGTLLMLPFVSITDYIWTLRELSLLLRPLGPSALFYLAAAVSDFFIPNDRMVEHKIQSGKTRPTDPASNDQSTPAKGNKLVIDLDPVPKFLKLLVDSWAPDAMIVSFKLETDPNLLLVKAEQALKRYSHHLVIGNLLATRAWEVVFVEPGEKERWVRIPTHKLVKNLLSGPNAPKAPNGHEAIPEIESLIIPEVSVLHGKHIERSSN